MTRAQAWRFPDMGLRLERAVYLGTLLDATLGSPEAENPSVLEVVLEVVDSSITFRSRYTLLATVPTVFGLVLLDDKNPRSVLFQINQLAKHFEKLPQEREDVPGLGKHLLRACVARLNRTDARELGRPARYLGRQRGGGGYQGNAARFAPNLGRHRRELLRALDNFTNRPGERAMTYLIVHRTLYEYAAPVSVSHHVARLEPRPTPTQTCGGFSLEILPPPTLRQTRVDYFSNQLCFFSIQEVHQRLEIVTRSRVTVRAGEPPTAESTRPWEEVMRLFRDPVSPEVVEPYQFVFDSPQVRAYFELADYARESFPPGVPLLVGARELTRRIFKDFKYDPKATTVATPLEEVVAKRRGVCQDFAHLGIACLRSLGLPTRYM